MEPGTQLGHYEVLSELGRGGMGEVYRARDTRLGREVAIKVLPAAFTRDEERLARLEREARMLASLNHPNIAAIYGLEESGDTRFLVLELVEGDTLAERLKRGAIPVEEALRLALQIAEALEAAQEKGIIHRDLKPANIKVTPDGKVKVLDFGLAKAFIGDEADVNLSNSPTLSMQATQAGIILGTAAYMSPEQAKGLPADKRADVFAFGSVLFEMLSGRQPFEGQLATEILASVIAKEPDYTALQSNLHPRIRRLLVRCLEKEPANRWQAVGDLRFELQQILDDPHGLEAQVPTEAVAPRSRPVKVATIVMVALIAGMTAWFLKPATSELRQVARFPLLLAEGMAFTSSPASMIAVSPDGARIAFSANGQIYLRNLSESEARPVAGTGGGVGNAQPVFSPDGQWLAYVQVEAGIGPYIVKRVPVAGGTPVVVFEATAGPPSFPAGLTWPTDDTIVFAHSDGILRVPANGGAPEILVERDEGEAFQSPQILPGEAVLFVRIAADPGGANLAQWDAAEIFVQTIGDDDRTLLWSGGTHARYLPTGHLIYAQGNALFALTVDLGSREVTGGPVPILEGVRRSSNGLTDAANYAVSDTGTIVSIPGFGAAPVENGILSFVDRNGDVSPLDVPPAEYRSPRISPDGRQLAVEISDEDGQGHIWIYDLTGGSNIRRLTQAGNNTRPIWTPDGERVTFGSERDGEWGIFERPVDGSTLAERLTMAESGRRQWPDSWHPDGETLILADAGPDMGGWDLWTYSRESGSTDVLAGGPDNEMYAAFSPDGQWVAYTDVGDPFGVRVQPFPPNEVVHQITTTNETGPVWTAAGDELFFRSAFGTGAQFSGMEVTTDGTFTFRNQRTLPIEGALLFQGYRDYDITPDGERFVMIYPASTSDSGIPPVDRIDVVLNWTQELLERVPVP